MRVGDGRLRKGGVENALPDHVVDGMWVVHKGSESSLLTIVRDGDDFTPD